MANINLQHKIFPDENAPIHRKKSVTAASVKAKGTVLGQKKPGARKALNDITNKSGVNAKASSKNKQIATSSAAAKSEINIAGERFLHDHSKCIKEQQNFWDDHSDDLFLLHLDSNIKAKPLKYGREKMDAKNNLTCDEPEEIQSPKLNDWLKSSTPWRSPIRHGSMMPSTPLTWRFDSMEFELKEDSDLF